MLYNGVSGSHPHCSSDAFRVNFETYAGFLYGLVHRLLELCLVAYFNNCFLLFNFQSGQLKEGSRHFDAEAWFCT